MRCLHYSGISLALLVSQGYTSALIRRADSDKCTNLHASSNNGDRKIAIVIDSSTSMLDSDPTDLRLTAASNVITSWLIPQSKASGDKPADLVTVVDFSDDATLDYPLGDPGAANASLSEIDITGGTFIASGVEMAIEQLTGSDSGETAKRSGILVLTDGEDSDTLALVDQINRASGLGIRVSFGFLSLSSGSQDATVLSAIMKSGGKYSTIFSASTANAFINLVLVNGLTENDNPEGSQSQLLGGLSVSRFISGDETIKVEYEARKNEVIDFTVDSVDAGRLSAQAVLNGKVVDSTTTIFSSGSLIVSAKNGGTVEIQVKAKDAPKDSIFTLGAVSNLPTQNCTVSVGEPSTGLTAPAIGGLVGGIVALLVGLGACSYFFWKKIFPPKSHLPISDIGEPKLNPSDCTLDAKTGPSVETYPLDNNLQPYGSPPPALSVPPYIPPKKPAPPKDKYRLVEPDAPPQQPNSTSDQPPPNTTSDQPPQPTNPTGDQPPPQSDVPPSDNYQPPQSDIPPSDDYQPPQQPELPEDFDFDHDFDHDHDHDHDHDKKRRRYKTRNDKCGCLQCPECFDCGSRCTPDCSTTASTDGITGGRICSLDCRVYCKHEDRYDCSTLKAHKKHRHRCHRCRAHNHDAEGEGRHETCPCWSCETCTDCTVDCGPGGCPRTAGLVAGNGHVHVRHRCSEHSQSWL